MNDTITLLDADLSDLRGLLSKNDTSYSQLQKEVQQVKEQQYYDNIQFYPRKYRKCTSPKDWSVYGISMQPFLYDGDEFHVERVHFRDVELGDVIVYKRAGSDETTIHAVVAIYTEELITAGYNNKWMDFPVLPQEVKYRYCEK